MIRRSLVLACALAAISSQSAISNDKCSNAVTTNETAKCSVRDADVSEKDLKQTYQGLHSNLIKAEREYRSSFPDQPSLNLSVNLARAQKDWDNYRHQSCQLEYQLVLMGNPNRGNYPALAESACRVNMARKRSAELKSLAAAHDIQARP